MDMIKEYWEDELQKVFDSVEIELTGEILYDIIQIRLKEHKECVTPMEQIIMDIKKDIMTKETCSTIKKIKLELLTTIKARYDMLLMGKK